MKKKDTNCFAKKLKNTEQIIKKVKKMTGR